MPKDNNFDFVSQRSYRPIEGPMVNDLPPVEYLIARFKEKDVSNAQLLTFYALKALHEGGEAAFRIQEIFSSDGYYSRHRKYLTRAKKIMLFAKENPGVPLPNGGYIMPGYLLSHETADKCPTLSSIYHKIRELKERK